MSLERKKVSGWGSVLLVGALATLAGPAWAQSSVQYGRITNVSLVNTDSSGAQVGGALLENQLLAAQTDDEFDRAERRVRLLCGD